MIDATRPGQRMLLAVAIAFMLAGCGPSLSGKYVSEGALGGMMSFDFTDGDTVRVEAMGQIVEGAYKVEGKDLKITANNMTQIFVLEDDGCFSTGPLGRVCPAGRAR